MPGGQQQESCIQGKPQVRKTLFVRVIGWILDSFGKTSVRIGQKLDGQQQNTSAEKDVDMQTLHAWRPTVENFQRTHCRGTRRYTSQAKVHTSWGGIGVSIRHCQIFQNVMPALHDNHRPDNVISGRNRKSRGRSSCDEGEKTFGESVKICKEKDSHNRS